MSKVIKATVDSNSSDDTYCRVKLISPGIWQETGLISSIGGIPLKKGDSVYVDVSEGYENPMILGRASDKTNKFHNTPEKGGSILFESSNGTKWTVGHVKNDILNIVTSEGLTLKLNGSIISIKNNEESLFKLILDTLKMYMKTKSADGMPMDAASIQSALEMMERYSKLIN